MLKKVTIVVVMLYGTWMFGSLGKIEFPTIKKGKSEPTIEKVKACRRTKSLYGPQTQKSTLIVKKTYKLPIQEKLDTVNRRIERAVEPSREFADSLKETDYEPLPLSSKEKIKMFADMSIILQKIIANMHDIQNCVDSAAVKVELVLDSEQCALRNEQETRLDVIKNEQSATFHNELLQEFFCAINYYGSHLIRLIDYFDKLVKSARDGLSVTTRVPDWQTQIIEQQNKVKKLFADYAELKELSQQLYVATQQQTSESAKK